MTPTQLAQMQPAGWTHREKQHGSQSNMKYHPATGRVFEVVQQKDPQTGRWRDVPRIAPIATDYRLP